jgi:hypothetical protein
MTPNARHARCLSDLVKAVGDGEGTLDSGIRKRLLEGKTPTSALGSFAVKVQENPSSITDAHVAALLEAGHSEDEIFECIVAAAMGAGLKRVQRVLRLLEGA